VRSQLGIGVLAVGRRWGWLGLVSCREGAELYESWVFLSGMGRNGDFMKSGFVVCHVQLLLSFFFSPCHVLCAVEFPRQHTFVNRFEDLVCFLLLAARILLEGTQNSTQLNQRLEGAEIKQSIHYHYAHL